MINYRIDEASEQQPQVLQVNSEKVRLYFDHEEVEREGMNGDVSIIHVAKFVELPSNLGTDALTLAKAAVTAEIVAYDQSNSVNEFTFNGVSMWLDDATRTKLAKRFDTDEKDGLTETKLIYGGIPYIMPIENAKTMLHHIESYARDCFDQTNLHRQSISELDSVEDLLAYDITAGYPTKLEF